MRSVSTAEGEGPAGREAPGRPAVLVIGLGNPLLGDDAVGWRVVEALERELDAARDMDVTGAGAPGAGAREVRGVRVETDVLAVGGIGLMERIAGAERVVLVDAIETGAAPPGTVERRRLSEIPIRASTHLDGTHDMPLPAALAAGRALGAQIPDDITVVAIEAVGTDVFSSDLTPPVAAAIPRAVRAILTAVADG